MALAEIHGYPVEVLRRPYQRNIGISVRPNGLIRVTASRSASERAIRIFLSQCELWLKKVLSEYEGLRRRYPPKTYVQGEGFLYLGQIRYLNFLPHEGPRRELRVEENEFQVRVPNAAWTPLYHMVPQPQLREEILKFYERKGREILRSRLVVFAERMGLHPSAVSFRSQKTRWGSCSSEGRISLNWRLVAAPLETLDYVVIHELAHLAFQNHSASFWQLVGRYSPNYRCHRQWLRDHQYEFDFLARKSELHLANS